MRIGDMGSHHRRCGHCGHGRGRGHGRGHGCGGHGGRGGRGGRGGHVVVGVVVSWWWLSCHGRGRGCGCGLWSWAGMWEVVVEVEVVDRRVAWTWFGLHVTNRQYIFT